MGSALPEGVRRLLLVRHGITEWNREGRFQGHLDPPLAASGREQARLLGARLHGRFDPTTLRRAFAVLMIAIAVVLMLSSEVPR